MKRSCMHTARSQTQLYVFSLLLLLLLQTFAFAVALPTTIAVVMLLVWHIRMVAANKTTIEHAEVRQHGSSLSSAAVLLLYLPIHTVLHTCIE